MAALLFFLNFSVPCIARYSKIFISLQNQIEDKHNYHIEMKKVISASIGGRCFAFDEDAYSRLSAYLFNYRKCLNKSSMDSPSEVMLDLENRLAELFEQGTGGASSMSVSLNLVNSTVKNLGMPDGSEEPSFQDGGSRTSAEQNRSEGEYASSYSENRIKESRRLFRDIDRKSIGGVCAGLAALLDIDITIIRVLFVLALVLGGCGLIIYIVLWIVIPAAETPEDKCAMRGLPPTRENLSRFSSSAGTKSTYRK